MQNVNLWNLDSLILFVVKMHFYFTNLYLIILIKKQVLNMITKKKIHEVMDIVKVYERFNGQSLLQRNFLCGYMRA